MNLRKVNYCKICSVLQGAIPFDDFVREDYRLDKLREKMNAEKVLRTTDPLLESLSPAKSQPKPPLRITNPFVHET